MPEIKKRPATMWSKLPVVLTIEETAIILGLSAVRLRTMAREGTVPAFKVGKLWRFEKSALMKFCGAIQEGNT